MKSTERTDLSYPPIISALNTLGPAVDFLASGDRIHQIDGISTIGLTNNHVLNLLLNGDQPAVIEIEYSLPEYSKSLTDFYFFQQKENYVACSCFFKQFHRIAFVSQRNWLK